MTTEEKLEHFQEASLQRAKEDSIGMISEYKSSLKKLEDEHIADKKRQADLQLRTEAISLKRAKNMTLSKERLEIKRHIIKKHNELKEKLFAEVKIKLEEYMDSPAYQDLLVRQIRDILKFAGNDKVTIYIDPADSSKLPSLSAAVNTTLTLSQYSFMGGTRAVVENRHILIDNSFATKLEEEKAAFTFDGGISHE